MEIPYFHVDAFTGQAFKGNPAGVCPLTAWLPDEVMQRMAFEHQLSETAFTVKQHAGVYELRWFTPEVEIDLCGHATLATAHVLWTELGETSEMLVFLTKSGELSVSRGGSLLVLDFPARPAQPAEMPEDVVQGLSARPVSCGKARDYLFVFEDEETVRGLRPDFARLMEWEAQSIIVTAAGREVDFVSRFFAPRMGVSEDPVTGSAHCTLIPFWAERLGKSVLRARQISARGGELFCELRGERVLIGGEAVTYLKGMVEI